MLEERPAIQDYLVATAYLAHDVRDINALMNFVLTGKNGFNAVVDYAAVSAARVLVNREQLNVPDIDKDTSAVVKALKNPNPEKKSSNIPLTKVAFNNAAKAVINPHVFDRSYAQILDAFLKKNGIDGDKTIKQIRPLVLQDVKNSIPPVTAANADIVIPPMIATARSSSADYQQEQEPTDVDKFEAAKDFDIDLFDDTEPQQEISEAAVKCAAQLYYGMVLGDELDVFDAVDYFTHGTSARRHRDRDRRLRDDLQEYVFSDRFTDLKTRQDRSTARGRPSGRCSTGRSSTRRRARSPTTSSRNKDFPRLWKVLMLESARVPRAGAGEPEPGQLRVAAERDAGGGGPPVQPVDALRRHGQRDHAADLRGARLRHHGGSSCTRR